MPEREQGHCMNGEFFAFIAIFALVKLILLWQASKIVWSKPVVPYIIMAIVLLCFYFCLPFQHIYLPEFADKTIHRIYWTLPMVTPALAIWIFRRNTGNARVLVTIVGIIDLIMVAVYDVFAFPMLLQ